MNKATQNALSSLLVRAALIVFGGYVIFSDGAFQGVATWGRAGVASVVFALVLALGEISRLSTEVKTLTLLTAGVLGGAGGVARDDRAAIDILIPALSHPDADTREKALKNLKRLTAQDLPLDAAAWSEWWASARDGFTGPRVGRL